MQGVQLTVVILAAGSFLLGIAVAAVVLVARGIGMRSALQRVEAGLDQLIAGNLAFRIRAVGPEETTRIASRINQLAEQTQDEQERQARQDEAHRRLITNISHDLRTPITSIAGYADALQRGIGDDPERYLSILSEKSQQLARLTDDLFYMSRIDSGDLLLKREPVDVCELARQQLLGFERQLTAVGAGVQLDLPAGRCAVTADESALRRVIDNVVSNALRHARGMTLLSMSLVVDDDRFDLRLADDGEGLSDDEQRLFERGVSDGGGGTGLGLAIARELATGMGMELAVESPPRSGLVFCLSGRVESGGAQ